MYQSKLLLQINLLLSCKTSAPSTMKPLPPAATSPQKKNTIIVQHVCDIFTACSFAFVRFVDHFRLSIFFTTWRKGKCAPGDGLRSILLFVGIRSTIRWLFLSFCFIQNLEKF